MKAPLGEGRRMSPPVPRVLAGAGRGRVVVRLGQPALRTGLRWLTGLCQ